NHTLDDQLLHEELNHVAGHLLGGLDGGTGEQHPALEVDEPHEKRSTGEHRIVSFKNMCAFVEGEPRDWIKEIKDEISYLRLKSTNIDEAFSVLMKIMKKVKLGVNLTDMKLN
ncbi:hypothetical protein SO802_017502, partial [Lithocarpus litseifolius]